MIENLIVRECQSKDEDSYVKLNLDFMKIVKEEHPYWESLKTPSEEEFKKTFREALGSERIMIIVAEVNNEVVAYANVWSVYSIWSRGKALTVDDLYVSSSCRNNGIGKKIIEYLFEYAKNNDYKRVQLHAEMDNEKAHKLYRAFGFSEKEMLYFMRKLGC
ncbi:GNAT family N-acetyltransferase [Crassaminicella profunda]|uniref:GNAT family N-acetyltransferase n=1 Tax=Crassaminicella profunda TaxID=1286698 RepID=UPI001CA64678|nr:GNAT family N-acetyltransferase [Crassaminicella profunda]QZY54155.1 GNAT family N-acetyltransferase [Crassaminicella profunda]